MDLESARRYAAAQSVVKEAIASHKPSEVSGENTTPVLMRFNSLWERGMKLLYGVRVQTYDYGGIVQTSDRVEGGSGLSVTFRLETRKKSPSSKSTQHTITAEWSHLDHGPITDPKNNPETITDAPLLLRHPDSKRSLALLEESMAEAERMAKQPDEPLYSNTLRWVLEPYE